MERQKLVAPAEVGTQGMRPCTWISPLDLGLCRNNEAAKGHLYITLNRTLENPPNG